MNFLVFGNIHDMKLLGAVHKLCQPKMGGSRPPLPPMSACQHLPNPPFHFCVSFVNIFNATLFLKDLFFLEESTLFDKSF